MMQENPIISITKTASINERMPKRSDINKGTRTQLTVIVKRTRDHAFRRNRPNPATTRLQTIPTLMMLKRSQTTSSTADASVMGSEWTTHAINSRNPDVCVRTFNHRHTKGPAMSISTQIPQTFNQNEERSGSGTPMVFPITPPRLSTPV